MKKVELLAPVGSYDAFISALNNGANAIYLAGSHFGAREKATFTNEEIVEMVKYAHLRGVRVHVTVNTLIYDDEMDRALEFIDFLYHNDVDAIIVQDLGIITLVHKLYPDLEIHASTQLNTLNYKEAEVLKNLGVTRVILAREAPLSIVKEIREKVGIEVEVFAHGALCMGYSGQCLLSSFTMKKSGNRGECLQLCRLPYKLLKNNEVVDTKEQYLLSCKDLLTLNHLDEIVESGACSIKIEGRVKSATYVGQVISVYRKYLDEYYKNKKIDVKEKDIYDLKKVFNREFTNGYLFNAKSREIVNAYRPNNIGVEIGVVTSINNNRVYMRLIDGLHQGDGIRIVNEKDNGMIINRLYKNGLLVSDGKKGEIVSFDFKGNAKVNDIVYKTSDYLLNKQIEENNKVIKNRISLDIKVLAFVGKSLIIEASDKDEHVISVKSDYVVDRAINSPTTKERIREQVAKLNESVYCLDSFTFEGDEMIIIPISIINKLRNMMVEKMNDARMITHKRMGKQALVFDEVKVEKEDFGFVYKVNNKEQLACLENVKKDDVYYYDKECIYPYPRISNGMIKVSNEKVLLNELSDLDYSKYMIANAYLNTTNIYALYTLFKLGFKRVCVSLEMSFIRIKKMIENYKKVFGYLPNVEVIVYGKIDLMITKYCPINKYLSNVDKGCNKCKDDAFYLEDRKGYKLELLKDALCNIRIINPKALHLIDYIDKLKEIGVSKLRIEFTSESIREISDIIDGYNKQELILNGVTRGYFSEEEN